MGDKIGAFNILAGKAGARAAASGYLAVVSYGSAAVLGGATLAILGAPALAVAGAGACLAVAFGATAEAIRAGREKRLNEDPQYRAARDLEMAELFAPLNYRRNQTPQP